MANSMTRKVVHKDRLSELPRNLQEIILDLLPITDAVRTSILSKQWRYSWTTIPHLIFDHDFYLKISPKLNYLQDPRLKTHLFLYVIDKILRVHNGPLLKLTLWFLEDSDVQMISDQIKWWTPLLSTKCVKQLTLHTLVHGGRIHYDFNPNIFSCLELTNLTVAYACFPESGAFKYLINLELIQSFVPMRAQCIFQCPVLETLTLKYCKLNHTNFHAPNLKCLRLETSKICLEGLKTLTEFSFCLQPWLRPIQPCNVAAVLGCLQKVEKLTLGSWSLQHLAAAGSPYRDPQPLSYLKNLSISLVNFTDLLEVSCLSYIIRSAPYLCKLEISGMPTPIIFGEPVKNYQVYDTDGNLILNHLEYVRFSNFKGFNIEMELIKFIAGRSPLLKKMFIHCSKAADAVAQQMKEFPFASSVAQICFV